MMSAQPEPEPQATPDTDSGKGDAPAFTLPAAIAKALLAAEAKLLPRTWDDHPTLATAGINPFTLMSWNVLQANQTQFDLRRGPHNAGRGIGWDTRAPLFLAEIARSGADIVCLCECNLFEVRH